MDEENVALQGSWLLGTQGKEKKEKKYCPWKLYDRDASTALRFKPAQEYGLDIPVLCTVSMLTREAHSKFLC